ncbi:unnamed protein product, partial [Effrenium voratum]
DETMLLAALRELEAAPAVPLLQLLQRPALLKRLQEANVAAACSLRRRAADAFRAALAQLRRRAVEVLTVLGAELAQELEAALFLQLSPLEAWAGDFVKDPEETLHVRRCRGLLWTARLGTSSACPAEQAAELLRRFPPPPPAPEAQVGECEAEEEAQEGEADGADAAQGDDDIEDFEDDASASLMPPIQLSMAGSGRSDAPAQLPLQASGWPEGKNPSCSRPPAEAKNWPQGNLRPPAEANDWPQGIAPEPGAVPLTFLAGCKVEPPQGEKRAGSKEEMCDEELPPKGAPADVREEEPLALKAPRRGRAQVLAEIQRILQVSESMPRWGYEVLGLLAGADESAAAKAFRFLARQIHPDGRPPLREEDELRCHEALAKLQRAKAAASARPARPARPALRVEAAEGAWQLRWKGSGADRYELRVQDGKFMMTVLALEAPCQSYELQMAQLPLCLQGRLRASGRLALRVAAVGPGGSALSEEVSLWGPVGVKRKLSELFG